MLTSVWGVLPPDVVWASSRGDWPRRSAITHAGLPYFHDSVLTTRIESNAGGPDSPASVGGVDDRRLHQGGRLHRVVEALGVVQVLADADDDGSAGIDRHGSHPRVGHTGLRIVAVGVAVTHRLGQRGHS